MTYKDHPIPHDLKRFMAYKGLIPYNQLQLHDMQYTFSILIE